MERDPQLLKPEFLAPLSSAVRAARMRGYILKPFGTRRDPWTQARFWRQNRTTNEIRRGIDRLKDAGALFLARILNEVGPQYGRWATDALPGLSWHQWVEACDLFVAVYDEGEGEVAKWEADHPGYLALHEECQNRGLTAPLPQRDPYHIQMRPNGVLHHYSWEQVDDWMKRFYGEQPA